MLFRHLARADSLRQICGGLSCCLGQIPINLGKTKWRFNYFVSGPYVQKAVSALLVALAGSDDDGGKDSSVEPVDLSHQHLRVRVLLPL